MYRSEKMNNPITLKQLRVFTCIARHENLSSAAEELCLSKGAASQALQELERRLDVLLFDRVRAKLQINEDGRLLRVMAEDILARIGDIEAMFGPQIDSGGGIRLGASHTIGNYILPRILAKYPIGKAKVKISNTYELCAMLSRFELDIALIEGNNHDSNLVTENWLQDEMIVVAPPGHPLSNSHGIAPAELSGQPQGCSTLIKSRCRPG